MDSNLEKYIIVDKELMGGTPCFRGTRVPIQILFSNLASGGSAENFLKIYDWVPQEAVYAVLEIGGKWFTDALAEKSA